MKTTQSGWNASELADQTAKQVPAYCNKPTERLVRYYTSIRILDKPSRTDADKRRAVYGERQQNQLICALLASWAGLTITELLILSGKQDWLLQSIVNDAVKHPIDTSHNDPKLLAHQKALRAKGFELMIAPVKTVDIRKTKKPKGGSK